MSEEDKYWLRRINDPLAFMKGALKYDYEGQEKKRVEKYLERVKAMKNGPTLMRGGVIIRNLGKQDQNLNYKVTLGDGSKGFGVSNAVLDKELVEWVTAEFCRKHSFFQSSEAGSQIPALVPHDKSTWSYLMQPIPGMTTVLLYNYAKEKYVTGNKSIRLTYGDLNEHSPGFQFRCENPVGDGWARNDAGYGITPWPQSGDSKHKEFEWNRKNGDYDVTSTGIFSQHPKPEWYVRREVEETSDSEHGGPAKKPANNGSLDSEAPKGSQILYWFDTVLIENNEAKDDFYFGQTAKEWGKTYGKKHKWGRNPRIRIEKTRQNHFMFYGESLGKYLEVREFETKILSSLWDPEFCEDPKNESSKALCHLFRHDQEAGYPSVPNLPIYNYLWVDEDSADLIVKKITAETVDNTGRYWLMENISDDPKRPAIVAKNVKLKKYSGQAAFTDKDGNRLYAIELVDPTSGKMEYRFNHGKARLFWFEIKRAKDDPDKLNSPTIFFNGREEPDFGKSILTWTLLIQMLDPRGFPNWYNAEWNVNLSQPEAIVKDDRHKTHGIWWDVQPCPVGENDPKTIQMFHAYHKGTGQGAEASSHYSGQVDMNKKCEFQSCEPNAGKVDCQGKWEIDLEIDLADVNGAPVSDPSKCQAIGIEPESEGAEERCNDALEGMKETDDHTVMTYKITRQACNDGNECAYPEGARKFRESQKIVVDGEVRDESDFGLGGGGGEEDDLGPDGGGGGGGSGKTDLGPEGGGNDDGAEDKEDKKDTYFEWNVSDKEFFHVRNMSMYVYLGAVFFMFMMMILLVA